MQSQIEQLINSKNQWMASHITEAEFPTPQSQEGLTIYQAQQATGSYQLMTDRDDTPLSLLSIYPVDCHPLTIRFSMIRASQWSDAHEQEAVIEYLTQIMLEADSPAQLFVGFYQGKPAATGMIFNGQEALSALALISDVCARPGANHSALIAEMTRFLAHQIDEQQRQPILHAPHSPD
ncbi:hypothetical protein [Photobacterium sp. TY1-4]|uniref:hypothetical protein n=1 Tax=Photobacterium sp. TY1-4 TaxID=2899122 RepID=UPI0021C1B9DB|nr:hypothetical protein [Photobacterium sp. TY1-4]UXI03975.1 hypothetical protein NH461_17835 [Photobacterium sp. TY1-4]